MLYATFQYLICATSELYRYLVNEKIDSARRFWLHCDIAWHFLVALYCFRDCCAHRTPHIALTKTTVFQVPTPVYCLGKVPLPGPPRRGERATVAPRAEVPPPGARLTNAISVRTIRSSVLSFYKFRQCVCERLSRQILCWCKCCSGLPLC